MRDREDTRTVTGRPGGCNSITHHCDWTEDDPALATVEALAVARNCEPTDCPPLYDAVDPDALNALFDGTQPPAVEVSFTYAQFDVTVAGTGTVTVRPTDDGAVST